MAAAGLAVYLNAFRGPFVLDDLTAIPRNPTIRTLWPPGSALSPPAHSPVTGRPVVNLSLALNHAVSGLDVWSYHLANVAVHVLSSLFLFAVVLRTLRAPSLEARFGASAPGIAAATALLWTVHPLITESVDYTIQRTELFMGFFFLLTFYAAIRSYESPGKKVWTALALGAFALGLGSKEVIVVAPAVILVYDALFWSSSFVDALKRHLRLYVGFAVVLTLFVLVVGTRLRGAFTGLGRRMSPWDYLLTQSGAIVHYLRLAVWPHPLVADYDGWPVATSIGDVLPWLLVVAALLALTAWGLLRRHKLALLGVWFFFILAPTSSIRPIAVEMVAERRMYLPLAAVVVLAVLGGHALLARLPVRKATGIATVAALALGLGVMTVRRNRDYRATLVFWRDVVAKRPDNPRARIWLAKHLREEGRDAEALEHLSTAVRLQPQNGEAHYGLGVALAAIGRTDEAITHYREALRLNPHDYSAHNNLGAALAGRGETDQAVDHYRAALRIHPGYVGAHYNLALLLARRGATGEAIEHLETAIRLKPDLAAAHRLLAELRGEGRGL